MSEDPVPDPADEARAADDLRSVPGWRRTGLVLGWGAVAAAAAALLALLADRDDPWPGAVILLLVALVAGLVALGFLRRAWGVPGVADHPAVVRARRWADVAAVAWGTAVVLRFVFRQLLDRDGTWLDVVGGVLGTGAVVAYVGMLVITTRWRPVPPAQL